MGASNMAVDTRVHDLAPVALAAATIPAKRESQFGLMWRRFKRHRLAVVSLWIVVLFYLVALLAEFLAPVDPSHYSARYTYAPPQGLHFLAPNEEGGWEFAPFVFGYKTEIDPVALRRTFVIDEETRLPVRFFVES